MLIPGRRAIGWRDVRLAVVTRAVIAAGGLALLASLWLTWGYDRGAEPDATLTAWSGFTFTAILQAAMAVLALASAALPDARRGGVLAALAGTVAAVDAIALLVLSNPARGARVALLAALLVAAAGAVRTVESLPGGWQAVPQALVARIAMAAGGALVLVALWAPWRVDPGQEFSGWQLYGLTDLLQLVLALAVLASAAFGRRAGALAGGAAAALVAANAARLLVLDNATVGAQLTLAGALVAAAGAAVLLVQTLPGDAAERWRRVTPDPILRAATAAAGLALMIPINTWKAFPPLFGVLVVATVAALASAALASRKLGAALGIAAGAVAVGAIFLYDGSGFLRPVQLGVVAGLAIAAAAAARLADRHPDDALQGWRDVGRGALAVAGSSWTWGALVTGAVYPLVHAITPGVGLDESWISGLYLATERGMDYGTQIVFTYGPLGFLTLPRLASVDMFTESVIYVIAVYFAAAFAIVATARRTLGLVLAVLLAAFALDAFRLVSPEESVQVAAASAMLLGTTAMIRSKTLGASRWWWWIIAGIAVAAAFHALIKLNTGLTVGLLAAVAVLGGAAPGRVLKSIGVLAGTFVVSLAVLWALLGQDLGALPKYLFTSYEVVKGFPEAMGFEESGRGSDYVVAGLVLLGIALVTLWSARSLGLRRGLALIAAIGIFEYSWFKQGFVRHDFGHHVLMFFGVAVPAVLAAANPRPRLAGVAAAALPRARRAGPAGVAIAAAGVAIAIAGFAYVAHPDWGSFQGTRQSWAAYRRLPGLIRAAHLDIAGRRTYIRDYEAVDAHALGLLQGHTVHFFPFEASIAWAYPELRWKPLPTMQQYVGYTPKLDQLNADALTDPRTAPERILRSPKQSNTTESPRATVEMLCRYREQYATERWQVLARVPDRCGPVTPAGTVHVAPGQAAPVPAAGPDEAILFAVDGLGIGPLEQVRSLLWKPHPRYLAFGGGAAQVGAENASTPTIVRVGANADFPGGKLDTGVKEVGGTVATDGISGPGKPLPRAVTVRFYKVRLNAPGRF